MMATRKKTCLLELLMQDNPQELGSKYNPKKKSPLQDLVHRLSNLFLLSKYYLLNSSLYFKVIIYSQIHNNFKNSC